MQRVKRSFTGKFKKQIVEEILSEATTLDILSNKYNISNQLIKRWKKDYALGKFNNDLKYETEHEGEIKKLIKLNEHCESLFKLGNYQEAINVAQEALSYAKKIFSSDNIELAKALVNLAKLYDNFLEQNEAGLLYKQALEMKERLFGKENPDYAENLNFIADIYCFKEKYSEAFLLYDEALLILERNFGSNQSLVALCLNNIGELYREKKNYRKAKQFIENSLKIRENILGPEHPDIAESLDSLGRIYIETGRYSKAEHFLNKSLKIKEKSYHKNHPKVADSLRLIAVVSGYKGNYSNAIPLLECSLKIYEEAYGPDHSRIIASTLSCLGYTYMSSQEYTKAEGILKRSFKIRERDLSPDNKLNFESIIIDSHYLSLIYFFKKMLNEAEAIYHSLLDIIDNAHIWDYKAPIKILKSSLNLYKRNGCFELTKITSKLLRKIYKKKVEEKEVKREEFVSEWLDSSNLYYKYGEIKQSLICLKKALNITSNKAKIREQMPHLVTKLEEQEKIKNTNILRTLVFLFIIGFLSFALSFIIENELLFFIGIMTMSLSIILASICLIIKIPTIIKAKLVKYIASIFLFSDLMLNSFFNKFYYCMKIIKVKVTRNLFSFIEDQYYSFKETSSSDKIFALLGCIFIIFILLLLLFPKFRELIFSFILLYIIMHFYKQFKRR